MARYFSTYQGIPLNIRIKRLSLCLVSAGMVTIYGCGGGGGGDTPPVPTSTSTIFTPSLGQFSVGTVFTVTKLDGTQLSTGTIGANGSVTLSLSNDVYPVVVTVAGATGVKYFDEGSQQLEPFETGSLRAVVPTPMAEVGVTALTNAAVANLEATGPLASATAQTISDANLKIATVFGLTDILMAPTPLSSVANTLDLARPADKYALILAALASSSSGISAAELAESLASDMKDGNLNGVDSTSSTPDASIPNAVTPQSVIDAYQTAADTFATSASQTIAAETPLVVTADVTTVVADTTKSDITLAKAMFAELRTTLSSFANGSTGFLDTQATRMSDDLSANVVPELSNVAGRLGALNETMSAFEDAKANTNGFSSGVIPNTSTPALVRTIGSLQSVWAGTGSFDSCWTDFVTPTAITKITCYHAGMNSADYSKNRIRLVAYELTATTANQYSYTATRRNKGVTFDINGQPVFTSGTTLASVPAGSGTVAKTVSGTTMTGLTLNGTMPPSASTADGSLATGVDTIAISAARTALTAANTYRYALSGSVSTSKLDATKTDGSVDSSKVVTLSLDSGTYFDLNEATTVATDPQMIGAKFLGTAQTTATKFTGSIDAGSFASSKNSEVSPTSIVFNGSINDISTGGAGQILTGKLEAAVADYANFDSSLPESSTNYLHASVTFTGTVQAPSRPLLKLVLAANKTGSTTGAVTLNYSYGTVSITGSGTVNSANTATNTMTLSNQAGILLVIANGVPAEVKKSGVKLATITDGMISYIDGVSESLN